MATKLNRKEEIKARLLAEGKVEIMNSPEAIDIREDINDYLESVKRDYQQRERGSQIEAAKFVFTS